MFLSKQLGSQIRAYSPNVGSEITKKIKAHLSFSFGNQGFFLANAIQSVSLPWQNYNIPKSFVMLSTPKKKGQLTDRSPPVYLKVKYELLYQAISYYSLKA